MFDLHPLDLAVLLLYLFIIIGVGLWARRRVKGTSGLYQGNRTFGRLLTAMLNLGNMTDAGQTASVTSEIYRQGLSGVWFQNIVLFHTPFQWFTSALQRRARYIGPADIYTHRFESRLLAGLYAGVILITALYANANGYLITGRTLEAMLVKPETAWTTQERRSVEDFKLMKSIEKVPEQTRTPAQQATLATLQIRNKQGELKPFISYIDLGTFYIIYALLIALYVVAGGLLAVAILDVIQGVLLLFLSLALIPAGLSALGGLTGLSSKLEPALFDLFGTSPTSDYTWYWVAALALLNLVVNAPKSFTLGGSARDERTARIGFVTGAGTKRLMMIAWAFTGLIAAALYAGQVSDPTAIWGYMTRNLLGAGALGLMIAAIFSANMDGNATISLDASAAAIKNIYLPFQPNASERRQLLYGRLIIAAVLGVSILLAHYVDNIVVIFTSALSIGSAVGASIWLAYFWRRLTTRAVIIQMSFSILLSAVAANVVPLIPALAHDPSLLLQTTARTVQIERAATQADVSAGLATVAGTTITVDAKIAPTAIFFTSIETDSAGVRTGKGPFRPSIWLMAQCGVDFTGWRKAGILTAEALFNVIVPFILLIAVSLVTRPNSDRSLREFYARVHTPVVADPELDAQMVQAKIDNPELVEQNKIFPGTNWEFWRPTRFDILGLLACFGIVAAVIALYLVIGSIGR